MIRLERADEPVDSERECYRRLARMVIVQAACDLTGNGRGCYLTPALRETARQFFDETSDMLQFWCTVAECRPAEIARRMREAGSIKSASRHEFW